MRRGIWIVVGALAAAVAIAVAVVGLALGGSEGTASVEDYEVAVVNARDRTDFALGRLSRAQSLDELLERMDEAAAAVDSAAEDLDDEGAPERFEDETDELVRELHALADDVQGTADQARVPGFEDFLLGAAGLDFPSWDRINAIFAELREQGVAVQPLTRHTTS
jgi:hypothetical protein